MTSERSHSQRFAKRWGCLPASFAILLIGVTCGVGATIAWNWVNSPVSCGTREIAIEGRDQLEASYSPPFAAFELSGYCDDWPFSLESGGWFGVEARVDAATAADAAEVVQRWDCVEWTSGPFWKEVDRRAHARFRCEIPKIGEVRISVDHDARTLHPRPGPGVPVFFAFEGSVPELSPDEQ